MSDALVIGRRKAVIIQNNPSVSEGEINDTINTVGKVFKSEVITSDQPWIVPYGIVGNKLDVRLFGAGAAGNPETGQGGGGGGYGTAAKGGNKCWRWRRIFCSWRYRK